MERWTFRNMDADKIQILDLSCQVCNGNTKLLWKEGRHVVLKCKNCGIIFCPPTFYRNFSYNHNYFNRWYLSVFFRRKRHLRKLLTQIERVIEVHTGKLLDIGCGIGLLLEIMREKHYEVQGIDTSLFAVNYCRQKGFYVMNCNLNDAGYSSASFDMITVFDVIAHLQNPVSYLKEIHRILKDGGFLIIKTPYHPAFLFRFANFFKFTHKSKSLIHIPAQIFHFTPFSIKKLLSSNNFDVINIGKVNDIPAIFISFSLKSMIMFCIQLLLRVFYGSDSMIIVARKI